MNRNNILNSIFVVSAMIDALILAEIAKAQRPSVIGKTIIPLDNSWAKSVETDCDARVYGKKFVCITEPYKKTQKGWLSDEDRSYEMVKAKSVETGRVYEFMFAEEFLVTEE